MLPDDGSDDGDDDDDDYPSHEYAHTLIRVSATAKQQWKIVHSSGDGGNAAQR